MLDLAIALVAVQRSNESSEDPIMITGAHFLLYSTDPAADTAFLQRVFGWPGVDGGDGMTICALPPAEIAVHPGDRAFSQRHAGQDLAGIVLYLQCADVDAAVRALADKGASCEPVSDSEFGSFTAVHLPSGAKVGLYQPSHPTATGG
ncbi:MAG: VOC family protein [Gemmatimonadaceae bacterium]